VRLLLDTHTLIWAIASPDRLPPAARSAIRDAANDVFASLASAWEISIKVALRRLDLDARSLAEALAASGMEPLGISLEHAARVATLPPHHRDPFDRMLVAQALCESLTLVSRDREIARYGVEMLWREAPRAR